MESRGPMVRAPKMSMLKKLFWVYFLLLIFEGALRKWVLPQLSGPLLVVRDPIGLLIIWEAYRTQKWPREWSAVIGVLSALMLALGLLQLVIADNQWFIALYGLRSYLLPFPVALIMGSNLDEEDLRKFGNWTILLLLPLTALEIAQYAAPTTSFLNVGAYQGSEQLTYALGHIRASATFSYVVGPMSYIPLALAFILYGMANSKFAKKWLLSAGAGAVVLSIPIIGSRTLVFLLASIIACLGLAAFFGVSQFVKSLQMIAALLVVSALVARLPIFADATDTLLERFSQASTAEGSTEDSIILRVIHPVVGTIEESIGKSNWLGVGLGHGANAVSTLLTGTQGFTTGEEEFPRVINEFGLPAGLAYMMFRLLLGVMIIAKALSRAREHQPLAWLMVPLMFWTLVFGVFEQPTEQGFMVMSVAFSLAALRLMPVPAESVEAVNRPLRQRIQGLRAR